MYFGEFEPGKANGELRVVLVVSLFVLRCAVKHLHNMQYQKEIFLTKVHMISTSMTNTRNGTSNRTKKQAKIYETGDQIQNNYRPSQSL